MIEHIKLDYDLDVFLNADYEQHHGSCISYQIREQKDQHKKAGGFPKSYSEENTKIQFHVDLVLILSSDSVILYCFQHME